MPSGDLRLCSSRLDEAGAVRQLQQRVVVRLVCQLRVEHDVLETDGDVGAERAQRLAVEPVEFALDLDQRRHRVARWAGRRTGRCSRPRTGCGPPTGSAESSSRILPAGTACSGRLISELVLAGGRDHAGFFADLAAVVLGGLHADQALGQRAQQRAQLRDHALGEAVQAVLAAELGAGLDDHLQALPVRSSARICRYDRIAAVSTV